MGTEDWTRVSRLLDYVMQQPSGGAQGVRGEPEKPKKVRKPKAPKPEQPMEQQRMF